MNSSLITLASQPAALGLPLPSPDTLWESDSLLEATLVWCYSDPLLRHVTIVLDLRTSLYFRDANTGVLIAKGTTRFTQLEAPRRRVFVVSGEHFETASPGLRLTIAGIAGERLEVEASGFEFWLGDIEGIGPVAASIHDSLEEYRLTSPRCESIIEVRSVSTRGVIPSMAMGSRE